MPKSAPKTGGLERRHIASSTCQSTGARKRKHEPAGVTVHPYQLANRARSVPITARSPSTSARSSPTVSSSTSDQHLTTPPGRGTATDLMLQALGRIRELQDELDFLQNDPYAEDTDDEEVEADGGGQPPLQVIGGRQAEAIGWAVCARETMYFLQREGIPPDSPLMVNLRRRLIGRDREEPDEGLASC